EQQAPKGISVSGEVVAERPGAQAGVDADQQQSRRGGGDDVAERGHGRGDDSILGSSLARKRTTANNVPPCARRTTTPPSLNRCWNGSRKVIAWAMARPAPFA